MATQLHNPLASRHEEGLGHTCCLLAGRAWTAFTHLFSAAAVSVMDRILRPVGRLIAKAGHRPAAHAGGGTICTKEEPAATRGQVMTYAESCVACEEDRPVLLHMSYQEPMTLLDPDDNLLAPNV